MADAPLRVQRRRTKGAKLPPNTICVIRPNVFGNRWKIGAWSNHYGRKIATKAEAAERYETEIPKTPGWADFARDMLAGCNLACWCKPGAPCHADVLLELANLDLSHG